MEAASTILRKKTRRNRCLWISIIVAIVVVLVVVIPTAVVLTRKHKSSGVRSTVLLPLYIYPTAGAWNTLFDSIDSHRNLNFTIIINPDSGPGSSSYPGDDYATGIRSLNAFPNVRTVGYVKTGYGSRNVSAVVHDVETYSGWASNMSANFNDSAPFSVDGCFFDEVQSEYSSRNATYYDTANQAVKNASGFGPDKLVIHNPGVIPDTRLNDSSTDVTVVFEEAFGKYNALQADLVALPTARSRYSYLLHSVPPGTNVKDFLDRISHQAEYLFLTESTQNYYESFAPSFESFVNAMPT